MRSNGRFLDSQSVNAIVPGTRSELHNSTNRVRVASEKPVSWNRFREKANYPAPPAAVIQNIRLYKRNPPVLTLPFTHLLVEVQRLLDRFEQRKVPNRIGPNAVGWPVRQTILNFKTWKKYEMPNQPHANDRLVSEVPFCSCSSLSFRDSF